jgi:hypothetical protein
VWWGGEGARYARMLLIFSLSRCSLKKRGELRSDVFDFFFVALLLEKEGRVALGLFWFFLCRVVL